MGMHDASRRTHRRCGDRRVALALSSSIASSPLMSVTRDAPVHCNPLQGLVIDVDRNQFSVSTSLFQERWSLLVCAFSMTGGQAEDI